MSSKLPYYNNTFFNDSVNNLDQLSAEYARIGHNNQRRNNVADISNSAAIGDASIAGMSTGASVGNALGSIIGTFAGSPMIGGIAGSILGGGIGAGIGYGTAKANENSNIQTADALNILNDISYNENIRRAGYSADVLQDRLYRQSEAHAVADGGKIERKQMSLKDFSDFVLKKKPVNDYAENSRIVRTYCKGGVKISFK